MRPHEEWFAPGGGHESIAGFLTAGAAETIALLLSAQLDNDVRGSLVEIGTYKGKTFAGLMKAARPDEPVVGFDLFVNDVGPAFRETVDAHRPEGGKGITAVRGDTCRIPIVQYINHLQLPARFVHIDGGHTREIVLNDAQLTMSYLAPRAIVIFDDFLHDWYPDLTEGIIEAVRSYAGLVPLAVIPRNGPAVEGGSKLVCTTPDGAELYAGIISAAYAERGLRVSHIAGRRVLTFQRF